MIELLLVANIYGPYLPYVCNVGQGTVWDPPIETLTFPGEDPLPELEWCGFKPDHRPVKCECTEQELRGPRLL